MKTYTVSFSVSEKLLPTIVGLLASEIGNLNIVQTSNNGVDKTPVMQLKALPKPSPKSRGGHIPQIILEILSDGKHHKSAEFEKALVAARWWRICPASLIWRSAICRWAVRT